MPRSRNIKHNFFVNDELAEIDPLGRLLFIGLWTIANYNGDLEYKPKKIKALVLPYDECDIEELMINLDKSRFISIYSMHGCKYIHINNFCKHQNPHKNEKDKGTDIPEYNPEYAQVIDSKGVAINRDKIDSCSDKIDSNPADSCFLIPDSGTLKPDSCSQNPDSGTLNKTIVALKRNHKSESIQIIFDYWQKTMGHPRAVLDDKRKSLIRRQLKNYSENDLKTAIYGCSITPWNMGKNPDGRIYDSIELILRDAKHIDDFIRNADKPPAGEIKTIEQTKNEALAQADRVGKKMFGDDYSAYNQSEEH
jgi:uncharacterized protein YlbG (UPF0298 family)